MRKLGLIMTGLALPLVLVACGSDDDAASGDAGVVSATQKNFQIDLDKDSTTAGKVTFEVHNEGPSTHEFVVVKTDLAADALPLDDEGNVDEDAVDPIDELEDIAAGDNPKLDVDLEAGTYVVFCNVPSHYGKGMHATITVT